MNKGYTLMELLATLCIIGIIVIILINSVTIKIGNEYEYIDYNNNKGRAYFCKVDSIMYCELDDGTRIEVKQFKLKNN